MKPILAALALCAIGTLMTASSANATTITFGTFNGPGSYEPLGSSYIEGGFAFVNQLELDRWENGSVPDSDPTPSTGLFTNWAQTATVISRAGGGGFDLLSIDFDDVYNQGSPNGLLNYEYGYFGGSSGLTGSLLVDEVPGFSTILLNLANLSYFSFTPSNDLLWVQFDNVRIAGDVVPIPATLPLFASALAALGWVARRRARGGGSVLPRAA